MKNISDTLLGLGQILGSRLKVRNGRDEGLIRMFQVEYFKEYKNAVRNGATVDGEFVRNYLDCQR